MSNVLSLPGELLNIAELLDGMQQSIESLSGLPEFADAQKQVDAARAQLSSLVGPQMDQALAAGQLDQIGEMVLVCRKMGQPAVSPPLWCLCELHEMGWPAVTGLIVSLVDKKEQQQQQHTSYINT